MDLALACGSIFIGVSTFVGWVLWQVRTLKALAAGKTQDGKGMVTSLLQPTNALNRKLLRAGYRSTAGPIVVVCWRFFGVAATALFARLAYQSGWTMSTLSMVTVGLAIVAWSLPEWWLSARVSHRYTQISHHLIDMLDLLVICLEAGLSFNASMVKVAAEMGWTSPILADELMYTNHEILMGRSRADALKNLGQRCGGEDFNALLAVVIQSEKFGMSLAKTFRLQVESMRQKRRQRVQEITRKMPVKMVFPLVGCVFPQLMIILLGPAAINIYLHYIKG